MTRDSPTDPARFAALCRDVVEEWTAVLGTVWKRGCEYSLMGELDFLVELANGAADGKLTAHVFD